MVAVRSVSSGQAPVRQASYGSVHLCSTDEPYSVRKTASKIQCAALCTGTVRCQEYSFDDVTKDCSIYKHKPLFYEARPGCSGYQARHYYYYYYYYYECFGAVCFRSFHELYDNSERNVLLPFWFVGTDCGRSVAVT